MYRTPKGVDEQLVEFPATITEQERAELERRSIAFYNWNNFILPLGPGLTKDFFDEVRQRIRENKSIIIAITGPPGEGKTWCGLRLCEIFQKAVLNRRFDTSRQVCFTHEDIARIVSEDIPLKPGSWIIIDEAHMATGARHWGEHEQKELVDQIAAIRSRGICVIVVVLHISMLDKILREFALTYHIHMDERGKASPYRLSMARFENKIYRDGKGQFYPQIPSVEDCPSPECLRCKALAWCTNMRAIYERRKSEFLKMSGASTLKRIEAKKSREEKNIDEYVEIIYKYRDSLRYTQKKMIDPTSIQMIFEKEGKPINMSLALELRKKAQWKHPDLKPESTSIGL